MKIGRDAKADKERVRKARNAIGPETELFVDANGAYSRQWIGAGLAMIAGAFLLTSTRW